MVGKTKEGGAYFQRLHALKILSAEQAHSPVLITATVAGAGNGGSGGKLTSSQLWENQRTALNSYNGQVYIEFAAHGDNGPWHGWVPSYDLAQTAAVCLSPNGFGNSVWASGAGMPIDTSVPGGRMFLVTGYGTYATYPPFNARSEFGDSIVTIDLSNGGLKAVDAFTPINQTDNGVLVYAGPIAVGTGSTMIEAMALASGLSQSAVVTATYGTGPAVTASPTFSPAARIYTTTQNVTIAHSTSGAPISVKGAGLTIKAFSSVTGGRIARS